MAAEGSMAICLRTLRNSSISMRSPRRRGKRRRAPRRTLREAQGTSGIRSKQEASTQDALEPGIYRADGRHSHADMVAEQPRNLESRDIWLAALRQYFRQRLKDQDAEDVTRDEGKQDTAAV